MKKAIIIGGGVAGLSASIYLQQAGLQTVICEKHGKLGGNLTSWHRQGYCIDNCLHWLTGTNPASAEYKMWENLGALGEGVRIYQPDSLYTVELDGRRLALSSEIEKLRRDMLQISPEDAREINSFIYAVSATASLSYIGGRGHNRFTPIPKLLYDVPVLLKYVKMSTGELAARFKHPLLREFITAFWGEDFGVLALLVVFANFQSSNAALPRGGSQAMAERMQDRCKELGAELLLGKCACKINHTGGIAHSVDFTDGTTLAADYIVVTPEPEYVFDTLIDMPMPSSLKRLYDDERMKRFSAYHVALSCDSDTVPFEGDLIFPVADEYFHLLKTRRIIIREFSHEPDFAPLGKNILQTMTFTYERDAQEFIDLYNGNREAYESRKHEIGVTVRKIVEEHFPTLKSRLGVLDVWTPATYRRYTNAPLGSFMSFALPRGVLPMKISSRIKGLKNVYLATQWQRAPGGLPIAADAGMCAAKEIIRSARRSGKGGK